MEPTVISPWGGSKDAGDHAGPWGWWGRGGGMAGPSEDELLLKPSSQRRWDGLSRGSTEGIDRVWLAVPLGGDCTGRPDLEVQPKPSDLFRLAWGAIEG